MFIEKNTTADSKTPKPAPLRKIEPAGRHDWEGDNLPTLQLCAEVDLAPINQPLVRDVAVRAKRAIHPQLRGALVLLLLIFTTLTSYIVVSRYVVAAVIIKGRSMTPTLHDGERYMLNRWIYHFREPSRGDLVVIRDPGHSDFAVKRIVGLPKDTVLFEDGKIYLNGLRLSEPYLAPNTTTAIPDNAKTRIKLAQDQYLVLGDNRGNSEDSRFYGAVTRDCIIGMIAK